MRVSYLGISLLSAAFIAYVLVRGAQAQWFEDPSQTFQNITFDMKNIGSYNTSDCLYDMLKCWEAVKPDMICFWWGWYASVCGVIRSYCAERYGDLDGYTQNYNLVQGMCYSNRMNRYT